MRILYVVPYAPDRVRARSYNLIRELAAAGQQVTVFTLWTSAWEQESVERLRQEGLEVRAERLPRARSLANCLLAVPAGVPLQAVYCWEPRAARALGRIAAGANGRAPFDIIHVEHLRGARYGLYLKDQMKVHRVPVVWDSVDCISYLFRQAARRSRSGFGRWVTRMELGRTERFEGLLADAFDGVVTTSAVDAQALQALRRSGSSGRPIEVITNGVELEHFHPDPTVARIPGRMVLSGKMSYHANVSMALDFVREVLPQVRARQPNAELWIVGKDPPREVLALGQQPGVTVTGTVPDVRRYLQEASLAIAPLTYGAGVQFKVLEAMACSTPVVMTDVAARGLYLQSDREAVVVSDFAQFTDAVCRLLADPGAGEAIGRAGREYVERWHHWGRVTAKLVEVYDELIRSHH